MASPCQFAAAAKSLQSCPNLCDPIDSSPRGSPIPGILQARTLEWVAISFSNAWKWKVKVKLLSRVRLLSTPWTAAYQASPSRGFPGKNTGVGCHCLLHLQSLEWLKVLTLRSVKETTKKLGLPCIVDGSVKWCSPMENHLAVSFKIRFIITLLLKASSIFRGKKEMCIHKKTSEWIFIMAPKWEKHTCPKTGEWIYNLWCICIMEIFPLTKGIKVLIHAAT